MIKALKIIFNIGLACFFVVFFSAEANAAVPAPILIAPNEKTATADLKPLITGLIKNGSSVEIFIDGIFVGGIGVLRDKSGTANFAYRPAEELTRGWHKVSAKAVSGGQTSSDSNVLNFEIQLPFPAPTVLKPVVNQATSLSRPFIVGLAKNDSKIKIYIDKKYQGELTVKNHKSGTANFAFKPVVALKRGAHTVSAVAIDKRGKKSIESNLVDFSTKSSAIAQAAAEEKKEAVVEIKEPKQPAEVKSKPVVISENSGAVIKKTETQAAASTSSPASLEQKSGTAGSSLKEKEEAIKQDLKDKEKAALMSEQVKSLIGQGAEEVKKDQGMINEGRENQGRLKLDLILFILFLLGIVVWLLWVNRELIKERRAQTQAEENKNNPPGGSAASDGGQNNKLFL